jgi:ribosomal protein S18 acetylase RimI-like enzyme
MMSGREGPGDRGSSGIEVVPYEPRFERDIVDICWETGLMGESLAGTGRFEDRRLFAMIFALPWLGFEPEICRVAVTEGKGPGTPRRAVGYIIGTTDTRAEERYFDRVWTPRIAARIAALDWWRHPESVKQVMRFIKARDAMRGAAAVGDGAFEAGGPDHPAQLHINIHPDWQGQGLGSRLMASYLAALRERRVPGVFLETSDRNAKALPFYEKLGFHLVEAHEAQAGRELWAGLPASALTYAMKL